MEDYEYRARRIEQAFDRMIQHNDEIARLVVEGHQMIQEMFRKLIETTDKNEPDPEIGFGPR